MRQGFPRARRFSASQMRAVLPATGGDHALPVGAEGRGRDGAFILQGPSEGRAGRGVQTRAVLSALAVTTHRPSGLKDAEFTVPSCCKGFRGGRRSRRPRHGPCCPRWR